MPSYGRVPPLFAFDCSPYTLALYEAKLVWVLFPLHAPPFPVLRRLRVQFVRPPALCASSAPCVWAVQCV